MNSELISPDSTQQNSQPVSLADTVERLASIFMTISDIAVITQIHESVLRDRIADPSDQLYMAYKRGKAKAKAEINAREMELARLGSPAGIQAVRDNLLDMDADE